MTSLCMNWEVVVSQVTETYYHRKRTGGHADFAGLSQACLLNGCNQSLPAGSHCHFNMTLSKHLSGHVTGRLIQPDSHPGQAYLTMFRCMFHISMC